MDEEKILSCNNSALTSEHNFLRILLRYIPHINDLVKVLTKLVSWFKKLQNIPNLYSEIVLIIILFFTEADKAQLNRIQIAVCSMRDLRQLFLLLIRHYNPAIQTRQYLNDVICANHVLLELIENTDIGTNIMTSHLQQ